MKNMITAGLLVIFVVGGIFSQSNNDFIKDLGDGNYAVMVPIDTPRVKYPNKVVEGVGFSFPKTGSKVILSPKYAWGYEDEGSKNNLKEKQQFPLWTLIAIIFMSIVLVFLIIQLFKAVDKVENFHLTIYKNKK